MNADGTNVVQIASLPGLEGLPAWSPDGGRIAFSSDRFGDIEIFVVNLDGSNLTRLTTSTGNDVGPEWSPDGSKLMFTSSAMAPPKFT